MNYIYIYTKYSPESLLEYRNLSAGGSVAMKIPLTILFPSRSASVGHSKRACRSGKPQLTRRIRAQGSWVEEMDTNLRGHK